MALTLAMIGATMILSNASPTLASVSTSSSLSARPACCGGVAEIAGSAAAGALGGAIGGALIGWAGGAVAGALGGAIGGGRALGHTG